jgi:hypothetical protein
VNNKAPDDKNVPSSQTNWENAVRVSGWGDYKITTDENIIKYLSPLFFLSFLPSFLPSFLSFQCWGSTFFTVVS